MTGAEMHQLAGRLFPICRSITGSGVRETLAILRKFLDVEIKFISSRTEVFDWLVPDEWNVSEAWKSISTRSPSSLISSRIRLAITAKLGASA